MAMALVLFWQGYKEITQKYYLWEYAINVEEEVMVQN